jgi:release factor glutamine methyltransferase
MHLTGKSRATLVLEKSRLLSESEIMFLQRSLKRLMNHEPLQYITGVANFYGHRMKVNPAVLIPRPETEELVDRIIKDAANETKTLKILDVGTGSACIAISLKKAIGDAEVWAIDISEDALLLAIENAKTLGAEIHFLKVDILNCEAGEKLPVFDLIVSNPPYVTRADMALMRKNVTEYEPPVALFVDDDEPLIFYNQIVTFAISHLSEGGKLFFECNENNAREVASLMEKSGFKNVELRADMQGKMRMVWGVRPGA